MVCGITDNICFTTYFTKFVSNLFIVHHSRHDFSEEMFYLSKEGLMKHILIMKQW